MPADDTALTAPNQSVPARDGVTYAYRRFGRPNAGVPLLVMFQQPPSHRVHPDRSTGKDQTDE
jgi:hypothetical protein